MTELDTIPLKKMDELRICSQKMLCNVPIKDR